MSGRRGLTTHVLDTSRGVPAAGVAISLVTPDGVEIEAVTNADGRTDQPLVAELVDGIYQLAYDVGGHFTAGDPTGGSSGDGGPFLGVVPVHVGLRAHMEHVHVALLVTPWSYSVYRGS